MKTTLRKRGITDYYPELKHNGRTHYTIEIHYYDRSRLSLRAKPKNKKEALKAFKNLGIYESEVGYTRLAKNANIYAERELGSKEIRWRTPIGCGPF